MKNKTTNICSVLVPCQHSFWESETSPCLSLLLSVRLLDNPSCLIFKKRFQFSFSICSQGICQNYLAGNSSSSKPQYMFPKMKDKTKKIIIGKRTQHIKPSFKTSKNIIKLNELKSTIPTSMDGKHYLQHRALVKILHINGKNTRNKNISIPKIVFSGIFFCQ